ncbi:MAG: GMC family oxidoreductase N-terminal domain-containing protein [bacterium]
MSRRVETMEADVVIVGSGPGGAAMARELSRKGRKVILCEKGKYNGRFGASIFLLGMMEGMGLTFSREGTWVFRPTTVGGGSVVFCGTACKPPKWLKEKYDIELQEEVDELYREIPIRTLPDSLIGPGSSAIMGAAREIGMDWRPMEKWIRHEKCKVNCGKCALGCKEERAKWTAREYVEEARKNGAQLLLETQVDRVLSRGGKAEGVRAKGPYGWMNILAETVILSAGGQGTPPILKRSGVYDAGQGLFVDPMWFVMGAAKSRGCLHDIPMSAGVNLAEDGIVMTDMMPPPMMCLALMAFSGVGGWVSLPKAVGFGRMLSIMIKVRDGLDGRVNLDGSFSKPIDHDTWWKLEKGAVLAEEILQKAGVKRDDILRTSVMVAAHPGGTVRIGDILDKDCQTPIQNCYCMDTTVLPEPFGLPPVVTVVAMAKRLAKHLTAQEKALVAHPVA